MKRHAAFLAGPTALLHLSCEQAGTVSAQQVAKATPPRGGSDVACMSRGTEEQLKALIFHEARLVQGKKPEMIDRLAAAVAARLDGPSASSRDDALNTTICKARIILHLPSGARDPFSGSARLSADIEYAAQQGPRGARSVHLLQGAEPVIYRLAAVHLDDPVPPPQAPQPPVGLPEPPPSAAAPVPARQAPVALARTEPPARPIARSDGSRSGPLTEPRRSGQGRPGFDCRLARSRAERMICRDERLAAFDRVLNPLY